ncbi:MAG: TetR/AcrR family transcriptional regulator [Caulobacter sp.]|jgi:AcrR family transcriptional regulator|nr:TetR/AcrR family transcriptional regulator [Caulobacter sp.]
MPRKPATEEQKQAARRRLQKAASGLYADLGATGVSARAIADRAGVSVGALYLHFGSLQGLMQSLWREPLEQINRQLEQIASDHPDPVERLRKLLEAYVSVALDRPELFRGAFLFVRPETLPKPDREPLDSAAFAALLVATVADGQASGALAPGDPGRLAQLAWAGLHGALALPINFDRLAIDDTRALAGDMITLLLAALASPRPA